MAEKALSIEDLLALQKGGAKITTEQRPTIHATVLPPEQKPTEIVKFEELIEKLGSIGKYDELVKQLRAMVQATTAMVKSNEAIARSNETLAKAEIEKSKTQLEVLATLQALIKSGNVPKAQQPVDFAPLKSVLSEIKGSGVRPSYVATVNRNKRTGFIDQITLDPQVNH